MIYTVFMQRLDQYSHNLQFEVLDSARNHVAEIRKDASNATRLYYGKHTYEFPFSIKTVTKAEFPFPYPLSSNKSKKLGYQIKKDGDIFVEYYGEAAVVEKKVIFSKKIGFEVFKFNNCAYYMVKVGFPKESSHYYCLMDASTGQTVGVLERLQANQEDARARIYLTSSDYEEIMFILLATETVMTVTSNSEGQVIDPSAGKYISIQEKERNFLDRCFVERAKQN